MLKHVFLRPSSELVLLCRKDGRTPRILLRLNQHGRPIVLGLVGFAAARVFKAVLDHANDHEEDQRRRVRWLAPRYRDWLDHLQQTDEQIVDIGSFRQLV